MKGFQGVSGLKEGFLGYGKLRIDSESFVVSDRRSDRSIFTGDPTDESCSI